MSYLLPLKSPCLRRVSSSPQSPLSVLSLLFPLSVLSLPASPECPVTPLFPRVSFHSPPPLSVLSLPLSPRGASHPSECPVTLQYPSIFTVRNRLIFQHTVCATKLTGISGISEMVRLNDMVQVHSIKTTEYRHPNKQT